MVPYNTLEGRYSNSGGRSLHNEAYDEEAPSVLGAVPAKRQLFSGSVAAPDEAPKTCATITSQTHSLSCVSLAPQSQSRLAPACLGIMASHINVQAGQPISLKCITLPFSGITANRPGQRPTSY